MAGLAKGILRYKEVVFDEQDLTKTKSIALLDTVTNGAKLFQLQRLHLEFKVPLDVLVQVNKITAEKMLIRMAQERESGGLLDVQSMNTNSKAKRPLFADPPVASANAKGKATAPTSILSPPKKGKHNLIL